MYLLARTAVFAIISLIFAQSFTSCADSTSSHAATTTVGVAGNFRNINLSSFTIIKASILVDGSVVAFVEHSSPSSMAALTGTAQLKSGTHTLSFRIDAQTGSSASYLVEIVQVRIGTSVQSLPDKAMALSTGQSIDYSFTI